MCMRKTLELLPFIFTAHVANSCNMGTSALSDMHLQSQRAEGITPNM